MEKKLSLGISIIFQPLFIPLYSLLLVFNANTYVTYAVDPFLRKFIYFVTFLNAILLPMLVFYYFYRKKIIASFHMHSSNERALPFITMLGFHASTWYVFTQMHMPMIFRSMALGAVISVLATLIINFKWKVSVHMLGMGGIVGTIIGMAVSYQVDVIPLILMLVLLSGLVGYARLQLKAHTPMQVYVGFIIGMLILAGSVTMPWSPQL